MIEPRRDVPAALDRATRAGHRQAVVSRLDRNATGLEAGDDGGQAVALLDAQLGEPVHHRRALGEGGGDREHRVFVDHRRRARRRHLDALERPGADVNVGDRFAAFLALVAERDIGAHFGKRRQQATAQRVDADALDGQRRARRDQPGDHEERGRRRVAGHGHVARRQFGLAGQRDPAGAVGLDADVQRGAEVAHQPLGVIARRFGFDHGGGARRVEAGEQHRRFDLRRRHGQAVDDRQRIVAAGHAERQAHAVARDDLRADRGERLGDTAHRTRAQAGVAGELAGDRVARDDTHQEAHAGAGVAHVERRGGLGQAADADAVNAPHAVIAALNFSAQGAQRPDRAHHVVALEQPGDRRLADGERAEHQRPVRDRLVAGDAGQAVERAGGARS